MLTFKKIYVFVAFLVLECVLLGSIVSRADAGELKIDPLIGLMYGYDDNILFKRDNPLSDSFVEVQPMLRVENRTEVSVLSSTVRYKALRYINESDYDSDNLRATMSGEYKGHERLSSSMDLSFNKDLTSDTYLEETGRIIDRSDHSVYRAGGNVSYRFSNISSAALGYRYFRSDFEDQGLNDSESHSATLTYYRQLKNEIDAIFIEPGYYFSQTDFQDVKDVSLSVGWVRRLTETFYTKVQVGARSTTVEREDFAEDDTWGAKALFELRYKSKLSNSLIRFFHDLRTASNGRELTTDNLYIKSSRLFSPRFGIGASGRFVLSDKLSTDEDISKTYYIQLQPYIFYLLTENSSVSLSYQYQYVYDDAYTTDESVDRNKIWIQLSMSWPIRR